MGGADEGEGGGTAGEVRAGGGGGRANEGRGGGKADAAGGGGGGDGAGGADEGRFGGDVCMRAYAVKRLTRCSTPVGAVLWVKAEAGAAGAGEPVHGHGERPERGVGEEPGQVRVRVDP